MKIAVNTRLLINDLHGGIEWFTYESLRRITRGHPEHDFFFLFDRSYDRKYIYSSNITPVVLNPVAVHPVLWHYWMEVKVASFLKQLKPDLFISPDGMMPLSCNTPCLPVIHDINFVHRKNDLPFLKSLYFRNYFKKFAQRASRIATVSEYSKQDLVKSWDINPSKIDVVYNGVSDKFFPEEGQPNSGTIAKPYFIFVGNLSPRKNIPNLVRGFEIFKRKTGSDHRLVIVGDRFFLNGELDRVFSSSVFKDDIIFTGKKNPDELRVLYSNAVALIFVPWFEGFGVPIIEAMKCGTPVIASNSTSIPEIAGDAAILVDPSNPDEIALKMGDVSESENLRNELIRKGEKQASLFNWDNTADSLWKSAMKSINTQ